MEFEVTGFLSDIRARVDDMLAELDAWPVMYERLIEYKEREERWPQAAEGKPVTQPVMDLKCFRFKACLSEPVRDFGNHMLKILLVFTEDKHFLYIFRKITPD